MKWDPVDALTMLLPRPRYAEPAHGTFALDRPLQWNALNHDHRVLRSLHTWLRDLPPHAPGHHSGSVTIVEDPTAFEHPDAYRMVIRPDTLTMSGASPAGCFHALQTLGQLSRLGGTAIPCCNIEDHPDFAIRGLLHDVTRGKVPLLQTLKELADRLASLKVNQLQLNLEHAFVFGFDPSICLPEDGLTPDDVRALDEYCRERFIELVPALANLGHMGRILSMPEYRHLAEVEATTSWETMAWPERMRGFTLDCINPEAQRLVGRLWSDVLDAFSARTVNICGDEPWDLGAGKNSALSRGEGKADMYLGHLRRVQELCAARGKSVQFWSDVIRNYPDRLGDLLPGATVLHWGYDDRADYAGTAKLVASGFPVAVCPGVSGWKRTLNGINLAERNISTFARAGARDGAVGLINTDWGDHGHFNLLAASWHGIALGACCAWNAGHPIGEGFDKAFTRWQWHGDEDRANAALRAAARLSDQCESWRLLWSPCERMADEAGKIDVELLRESLGTARAARCVFEDLARRHSTTADAAERRFAADARELGIAAEFSELAAEKLLMLHQKEFGHEPSDWSARLLEAGERYGPLWLSRNKRSGLSDIQTAIGRAAHELPSFLRAGLDG